VSDVLTNSSFLSPIHVEVHNESFWYQQRKTLGVKRHKALVVTQNKNSSQWEAYIYKMKPREEDGAMAPQKSFASAHMYNCQVDR